MRNPSSKTATELGNKKKNIKGKSNSSSVNVTKMSNNNNNDNKTTPCCSKVGLKRGPWTAEEDEMLSNYIHKEGEGRWRTLPKRAGLLRCGKSCRLRWMNYLRPSVKRGHIAPDEEDLILRLHRLLGNRWSLIAGRIPGRTDNEIKNYWNTHLSKKLISQGIDPRTHKPLNPDHEYHSVQIINNLNKSADQAQTNPNIINNRQEIEKKEEEEEAEEAEDHNNNGCLNVQDGIAHFNNDHELGEYDESQLVQYHDPYNIAAVSNHIVDEEEEDVNYCSDQVFSSFLNSFINEDAFDAHHDHHHHSNYNNSYMMMSNIGNSNNNNIVPQHLLHIHDHLPPVSDALDTTNWESAFLSSPFNQNDLNKS